MKRSQRKTLRQVFDWKKVILLQFLSLVSLHSASYADYTPDSLAPPKLMASIGTNAMPITTSNPLAQKYFNQGINLLHSFWNFEAYRAFKHAATLDPRAAMPHWGIVMAIPLKENHDLAIARREALKTAGELAVNASERERLYIKAIQRLDAPKKQETFVSVMRDLIERYPNDVEAKLFLAVFLMRGGSLHGYPHYGKKQSEKMLRPLLPKYPRNTALHHYWIHAMEHASAPTKASVSAQRIEELVQNSGHLVHMPGHIHYLLGDYQLAANAFLKAYEVDQAYFRETRINPVDNWNYVHNLDYLIASYAELGKYEEALSFAEKLEGIRIPKSRRLSSGRFPIFYDGLLAGVRVELRFGKWNAATARLKKILSETQQSEHARAYTKALLLYTEGREESNSEKLEELELTYWELKKESPPYGEAHFFSRSLQVLRVASAELRGAIFLKQGNIDKAMYWLAQAVEYERELGYHEPPQYPRSPLETLAEAHRSLGALKEAKAAYEQALAKKTQEPLFATNTIKSCSLNTYNCS